MKSFARSMLVVSGLSVLLIGVLTTSSQGAVPRAPASGAATVFVDNDITTKHYPGIQYDLADPAPGAYNVDLFADMGPVDFDLTNEQFACSVQDRGRGSAIVVWDQVVYNGEFNPPVEASSVYRVTKNSDLWASCASERADWSYLRPLQISFTRLASLTTVPLLGE